MIITKMSKRMRKSKLFTLLETLSNHSSSDSDFRTEDSSTDESFESEDTDDDSVESIQCHGIEQTKDAPLASAQLSPTSLIVLAKEKMKPVCTICLSDNDEIDEMLTCDECGLTVHVECNGDINDDCVYWFCEPCSAGVPPEMLSCELCPFRGAGGLFKETDVGKWVHLLCALYIPEVKFNDTLKLNLVTLFELPYNRWGARACSLCKDARLARTGVCIGCDAGLCKTFFHVTCAQAAGLLVEMLNDMKDNALDGPAENLRSSSDAVVADPFYAQCTVHTLNEAIKKRKRNYQLWCHNMEQKPHVTPIDSKEAAHIKEALRQCRDDYKAQREARQCLPLDSLPHRQPRSLTTSTTACQRFEVKALAHKVDLPNLNAQLAREAAKESASNKLHMKPAFTDEFLHYYFTRDSRMSDLQNMIDKLMKNNALLSQQHNELSESLLTAKRDLDCRKAEQAELLDSITELHKCISALDPSKLLQSDANFFSVEATDNSLNSFLNQCSICEAYKDQQFLTKCDGCKLWYHIHCLNPPLKRLPKKSKYYGWHCSKCVGQ